MQTPDVDALLTDAQDLIESVCPNPYYKQAYRAAERDYWKNIPQWICDDFHSLRYSDRQLRCLDIGTAYGTLAVFCKLLLNHDWAVAAWNHPSEENNFASVLHYALGIRYGTYDIEGLFSDSMSHCIDFIIFTEVLEHLNFNPLTTLKKIRSFLNDKGRLYLSTPNVEAWGRLSFYQSWEDMPEYDPDKVVDTEHHYHYSEAELRDLLDKAGFNIIRFVNTGRHFNLSAEVKQ